jgi:hypothetical protein
VRPTRHINGTAFPIGLKFPQMVLTVWDLCMGVRYRL